LSNGDLYLIPVRRVSKPGDFENLGKNKARPQNREGRALFLVETGEGTLFTICKAR
jgi:hypothetical protein